MPRGLHDCHAATAAAAAGGDSPVRQNGSDGDACDAIRREILMQEC